MEDANNDMWDRLFALPDMDPDRSAEWSEGPSDRSSASCPTFGQRAQAAGSGRRAKAAGSR